MRLTWLAALGLLWGGCAFEPDLTRFPLCDASGQCPAGSLCLETAHRCVPVCGENCPPEDGGDDAGPDAAVDAGADAGTAGGTDAGSDAGTDELDAGTDAGRALALAASALPPAVESKPYAYTFMPTGGMGTYFFSLDGGLPGFILGVGGTLSSSAAPTPGVFPFSITVQDDAVPRASVTTPFNLEVRPLLRVASRGPLMEGRSGQAYSEQLFATGGKPPYLWTLAGGALPSGVSLSSGGLLQGSPAAGTASFGVMVTDSATPPQQASRALSFEVKVVDTLLTIATHAAAEGRVGTAYTQTLKAYGGTQPYSWSVSGGALPPGIMLVDSGTLGRVGGTPTMSGTFNFTVRCADLLTSQTESLSIIVY